MDIFYTTIQTVLQEIDPIRFYYPTSPTASSANLTSIRHGDIHFYGVGSYQPVDNYNWYVGRFNSEYGV